MDRTEEDLLRAVGDAPADDAPRLAYARWRTSRGSPHGELIAVQCELAALADDDPRRPALADREAELRPRVDAELRPRGWHHTPWLTRGFHDDERLHLPAADWLVAPDRWYRLAPAAAWWYFADPRPHVATLARHPALARCRGLGFYTFNRADSPRPVLTDADHAALARSPHLGRLAGLDLGHRDLGDAGLREIARAAALAALRDLRVGHNPGISAAGLRELGAATCALRRLERLDLSQLPPAGVVDLLARAAPPLRELVLRECHFGALAPALARALARTAAPLERLDLTRADLDDDALVGLAAGPGLAGLRRLDLALNPCGDRGLAALVAGLPALTELELWRCRLGPEGLARALTLPGLRALELGHVALGAAGVQRLLAAGRPLERLGLRGAGLCDADVAALLAAPWVPGLRALDLADNGLGDPAGEALLAAPLAPRRLELGGHAFSAAMQARLAERFGEAVVRLGE